MSQNLKTSEYVTLGHPDKVADYISEYILDKLIKIDPNIRYAVECQIKEEYVSLAGEITSKHKATISEIKEYVREAINKIGYTKEYQDKFGAECTICGDEFILEYRVSEQSPDISQGVNKKGWGDQGIFFGLWNSETPEGYGKDYAMAKKIGQYLYKQALDLKSPFGIDIKTQVTYDKTEKKIVAVVVAIPTVPDGKDYTKEVKDMIKKEFPETKSAKFTINGTGAYHIHGPIGDSGTTGRKLVVDFYGSGSRIGGGSPWTKDGTKADLTLNMFAREIAKVGYQELKNEIPDMESVGTELSCCIGKQEVLCITTAYDSEGIPLYRIADEKKVPNEFLINRYSLREPKFAKLCELGLFSDGLE